MKNYLKPAGILALALTLFISCSDDEGEEKVEDVIEETGLTITTYDNGELGGILVNQDNQSMYFFAEDVNGQRNCDGGCVDVWPPVVGEIYELEIGSDLDESDFGTIAIGDGQKQITYKGWPLYYFSTEGNGELEAPGATEGDGRGGVFHIAKPDYTVLIAKQVVEEGGEPEVYLVNDKGVSLYLNLDDNYNQSNCVGGCAGVWPPFQDQEYLVLPSSLNPEDFYTVEREDDLGPQASFKGFPMYFFSNDEGNRGSVLGQAGGPNQTFFVTQANPIQ